MSTADAVEQEAIAVAEVALPLVLDLAEAIQTGKIKTVVQFVEQLIGIGRKVVPDSDLSPYLTHYGVAAAETAADVAEEVKFEDENGDT